MAETNTTTQDHSKTERRKLDIAQRCRSVPYKRPFVSAIFFTLVFYLGMVVLLTSIVAFGIVQNKGTAYAIVGSLILCAFLWCISFFKRRKANCPLCKCTPFLDNFAHKHNKAIRFRPFNYGTTAVFNVMFTQRWRCMYCGTPFDLLKNKPSRETLREEAERGSLKE